MDNTKEKFLGQVTRYIKKHKLDDNKFGKLFCNDSSFLRRLRRDKGRVYTSTVDRCREWMKENK